MRGSLAVSCVLVLATAVAAEGAWVLWSQDRSVSPQPAARPWQSRVSYANDLECTRSLDEREALARRLHFTVLRHSPTELFLMEETGRHGADWLCLPDTVDPGK